MDVDADVDTVGIIDCSRESIIAMPMPNQIRPSVAGVLLGRARRRRQAPVLSSQTRIKHASPRQQDRAGVDDFRNRIGHPEDDMARICRPARAVD